RFRPGGLPRCRDSRRPRRVPNTTERMVLTCVTPRVDIRTGHSERGDDRGARTTIIHKPLHWTVSCRLNAVGDLLPAPGLRTDPSHELDQSVQLRPRISSEPGQLQGKGLAGGERNRHDARSWMLGSRLRDEPKSTVVGDQVRTGTDDSWGAHQHEGLETGAGTDLHQPVV